ncbi:MAG: hypothetical protein AB7S26_08315 [Sandaracinaceae bacterium]
MRDAGVDAGAARRDAGSREDAGETDAGPSDPNWLPVAGLPDYCPIAVAADPERLWRFEWEDCGTGCRRTTPNLAPGAAVGRPLDAWYTPQGAFYSFLSSDVPTGMRVIVLVDETGRARVAWRMLRITAGARYTCLVSTVVVGGSQVAFHIRFRDAENAENDGAALYLAPLDMPVPPNLAPVVQIAASLVPVGRTVGRMWASDDVLGYQMSPDGLLALWAPDQHQFLNTPPIDYPADRIFVVAERAYWQAYGATVHLRRATYPDDNVPYYAPAGRDIWSFGTDGSTAAWMEVDSTGAAELWTGTLTAGSDPFAPRRVRAVEARYVGTTGGHWFAFGASEPTGGPQYLRVFDLDTGERRERNPGDGAALSGDPYFATDDRVDYAAGTVASGLRIYSVDPNTLPLAAVQ